MANILEDTEQLKLINTYAEQYELTVDYVIEEFVINNRFTPVIIND
jgi:hypothetical protein